MGGEIQLGGLGFGITVIFEGVGLAIRRLYGAGLCRLYPILAAEGVGGGGVDSG